MSGESEYRYCSTRHMMCYPVKPYDINPLLSNVANSVNPFAFLCKHMVWYLTLTCKPTNEGWSDSL